MAKTAIAADVHQTFDVHRGLTTQITFDGEPGDLIPDFFQVSVAQILDFFGVIDLAGVADFASARAADAKDCSQADFGVLLRRNVDTCDTSHVRPLNL